MYFSKRLFSGLKSYLTIIVKILILEKGMNFGIQLYRLHYSCEPSQFEMPCSWPGVTAEHPATLTLYP